jgi:hypothetical protein
VPRRHERQYDGEPKSDCAAVAVSASGRETGGKRTVPAAAIPSSAVAKLQPAGSVTLGANHSRSGEAPCG